MSGQTAKLVEELVFSFYSVVSLQGLPFIQLYFIYIDLHRLLFIHYQFFSSSIKHGLLTTRQVSSAKRRGQAVDKDPSVISVNSSNYLTIELA